MNSATEKNRGNKMEADIFCVGSYVKATPVARKNSRLAGYEANITPLP